jgi:thymidylate synthase ThyX
MTTISAKVIADSIGDHAPRLTTLQLRYPRAVHAEFMTHRQLSRNASSSRAIPVERLIQDVLDDPFIPLHWGKNQKGMQAHQKHDAPVKVFVDHESGFLRMARDEAWEFGLKEMVRLARSFSEAGYHKQIVNRLLEPFAHINVVVTSTEWSNFLALRDHEAAEPHIRLLAQAIKKALAESTPQILKEGEWHLPYITAQDRMKEWPEVNGWNSLIAVSVARCARVSYMTHDGRKPDFAEDLALAERLLGSVPLHASPAEHQAKVDSSISQYAGGPGLFRNEKLRGNLAHGWIQFRKTLPGECQ